jgi:hypothetical protein
MKFLVIYIHHLIRHRHKVLNPQPVQFSFHLHLAPTHLGVSDGIDYKKYIACPAIPKPKENSGFCSFLFASPFEGGLGGSAPLLVRFLGASEKRTSSERRVKLASTIPSREAFGG